jgi:hypothetical protein
MDGQLVVARVPLPGYNGKVVDRGEVFKLIGARNDEKMIGLRMLLPFDQKTHRAIPCDMCGRKFAAESLYNAHKRKKSCDEDSQSPTRAETAELIGADPDKLVLDDKVSSTQRAFTMEDVRVARS